MSSNPDAQAGKKGGRVLDEFALHPDPVKLYSIAYPGITWGGQMEIVSTHRGSANFFNRLVEEIKHKGNPKKFSLHTVTLQDALDQGFLYKLQCVLPPDDERMAMDEAAYYDFIRRGCADEEQFSQEYMCVPADDAGAFLSYDLITPCEYRPSEKWRIDEIDRPTPALYVGIDVGRKNDLTVMWCVERVGDMLFTRELIELQKMPFSDQEKIIYPFLERPDVARVCIDATGLGMQFAERATEKFGWKVEPVTFTGPTKERLAYPVRSYFEDKRIRIPDSDAVRSDLRKIRKTTTAAGNIRFVADSDDDGHADRFWALALAIEASKSGGPAVYGASDPEHRERAVRGVVENAFGRNNENENPDGRFERPGKTSMARGAGSRIFGIR
jgi:phage FluMu gp28-like protein